MTALEPLGDRAWLARFETDDEAVGWAAAVRESRWIGVKDVVVAFQTVGVYADPSLADLDDLESRLRSLIGVPAATHAGRLVTIPVLYDGEDLAEVAERLTLPVERVIALHSERDYRVLAVGFQPGFPYAGNLHPELSGLLRRTTPRARVAEGSVAIVGDQTAIYPRESPGGWHLIGRSPMKIADMARGHFPIRAGDRLRFVPIDALEFSRVRGELLGASDNFSATRA